MLLPFAALAQAPSGPSSAGGRFNASVYGSWTLRSLSNISAGTQTVYVDNCFPQVGTNNKTFFPLATIAPLAINDPGAQETVTPTQVNAPHLTQPGELSNGQFTCSFVATFAKPHFKGFAITSATFGLEEAISDANLKGGGIIVTDNLWQGTTAMITTTGVGFTNVVIEDDRTGNQVYTWNGSNYAVRIGSNLPSGLSNQQVIYTSPNTIAGQTKPVIDVRDYGVIGDGTTDDTTALQNAVNAACGTAFIGKSQRVAFGPAMYVKVTSTITFHGCQGLTFDGQGQTGTAFYGRPVNLP